MKTVFNHSIRLACLAAALACSAAAARAQSRPPSSKLPVENLEGLAAKADRVVDVTLDENLLRFIPAAILKTEKNAEDAKKYARIASGFKGVYVRSFKFDGEGQWKESDISAIREELRRPGWTRVVNVRNRREGQNVEVYLMTDPTSLGGLAVVATEPTELTVVNIVGRISLEDFVSIQGRLLDFPDLGIEVGESKDDRKPDAKQTQPAAKKP